MDEFPEAWDEWLAFLVSHLPGPVREHDGPGASAYFVGGQPPEVAVRLTRRSITVLEFVPRTEAPAAGTASEGSAAEEALGGPAFDALLSPSDLVLRSRPLGLVRWRRMAPAVAMSLVRGLVDAARQNRLRLYRRCLVCGALVAPELMQDDEVCRRCAV